MGGPVSCVYSPSSSLSGEAGAPPPPVASRKNASRRVDSLCAVTTGASNAYTPGAHVLRRTPTPAVETYHGAELGWPLSSQL